MLVVKAERVRHKVSRNSFCAFSPQLRKQSVSRMFSVRMSLAERRVERSESDFLSKGESGAKKKKQVDAEKVEGIDTPPQ